MPFGRQVIYTDVAEITSENVVSELCKAILTHFRNKIDIEMLYGYYRGKQGILNRVKDIRPEIKNMIVANHANEIVSFKVGYLMGEPIQYISRGDNEAVTAQVLKLNDYCLGEDKASKDKELADWMHICGTSYRMVLPDALFDVEEDESPFEIFTLDPRYTFVVYRNGLGNKPMMAVKFIVREDGKKIYSVYTEDRYFEIENAKTIVRDETQVLGIPIIEYPLNKARIGAFEVVLPLLDAMNNVDSNRMDGLEQYVQALLLFHNVDISNEDFAALRKSGAIRFKDIDAQFKGEIKYITAELNQSQTQTFVDHLYNTMLTICGMPNRNGGTSTSDTGAAVIMRDGWSSAEARAKDTELMFKLSEKEFLKLILRICRDLDGLKLKLSNIEIRFTRRNYENISEKANVLTTMLNNDKIAPQLAYSHSGMFVDPELAWSMSKKYMDENRVTEKEVNDDAENADSDDSRSGIED